MKRIRFLGSTTSFIARFFSRLVESSKINSHQTNSIVSTVNKMEIKVRERESEKNKVVHIRFVFVQMAYIKMIFATNTCTPHTAETMRFMAMRSGRLFHLRHKIFIRCRRVESSRYFLHVFASNSVKFPYNWLSVLLLNAR